jgi:hypothetical protein
MTVFSNITKYRLYAGDEVKQFRDMKKLAQGFLLSHAK